MNNLEQRIISLEMLIKELADRNARLTGRVYTLENIVRSVSNTVSKDETVCSDLSDKCRRVIEMYS